MHRRQFLAAGVGAATLLAGCYEGGGTDGTETETATPTPTPTTTPSLALGILDVTGGESDVLVATVAVENRSDTERTGTVRMTARAGGDTQTVTRDVTVPAGESVEVDVTFSELTREAFADEGSFPTATVTA